MELKLQNGDYVPDGVGGLRRVWGQEALLQRVFYKLMARRGSFPFGRIWAAGCGSWVRYLRQTGRRPLRSM